MSLVPVRDPLLLVLASPIYYCS